MTKLTSLFLIIVFFLSVFIGITVGVTFKQAQITPTPTSTTSSDSSDTIGSLLVLGVNDFKADPIYLESAWLVTINRTQHSGENHIKVLLVAGYPMPGGQTINPNNAQYLEPHSPIILPREFLDNLDDDRLLQTIPFLTNRFYEDVIVIDEYGMNYIIELTNTNPVLPPPVTPFIKSWEDPEGAHDLQHKILDTLCSSPQILEYQNFTQVFNLFPERFKSTLTIEDILAFWQVHVNLASPPSISCSIYP